MSQVGTTEVIDGVGILTIDYPPVNALSVHTRRALDEGFRQFAADDDVKAIVLICAGRTFIAGADISEFGKDMGGPSLQDVFEIIENGGKPVVAAIHGTALGGGYELALICHYRIAVPSAKVGLPEVALGLLPGAGGTQRLPRIVGIPAALDLITGGAPTGAQKALALGMIDALAEEGNLREGAIAFAADLIQKGGPLTRVRDRQDKVEPYRGKPEIYSEYLAKHARAFRGFKAPFNIVKAIEAAAELPFEQGIVRERELFQELVTSTESAAQRYYFFAERQGAKVPDFAKDVQPLAIAKVGVIGAGTMGTGIAMACLDAGLSVTMVERDEAALDRGAATIADTYKKQVERGRLKPDVAEQRLGKLDTALFLDAVKETDLIIEAVFEDMDIKEGLFAELDLIAKPEAIIASNSSFLDLNEIAAATSRPSGVVGLHFFSPANVMRLLEIVRGSATSDTTLATALSFAKKIAKVPVVSGVGPGFIANRVMAPRSQQALQLALQGPEPEQIDQAMFNFGFAMGPFAMADLVGLDVIGRGSNERTLQSDLIKIGRLGQKKGGGFYDYDASRTATPSPVASQVIADFAAAKGVSTKIELTADEIVERLLYPVVNECAKILDEGIAARASDIDVACILGYGWPVYTGGPMFWADTVGLGKVVEGLEAMGIEPAKLLKEKAANGESFTRG
ncbi:3-hydroxyacyl-CoA dehydrogenase [Erythromicrobium ramosum]|uniref:3-hydroxyacyl-CoA dehydrogenase n=1 Tax=Erythrobacter ramosus TaxID=35811 RepID=A0ABR6I212_9SPHN|nr:3-hydroxyacyl-CoA dehydrogenase NAD-binding domain-containing protein [Erythrobacter ramosus]MBB3776892.1 3-hydroxyacyl-CoA dehydrogenase [Erythrobacter ramosus]